ncbi:MAG: M17 family peptidase N-terminal domain-containing protein, partial [Burkholderiales bacterium]
MQFSIRAQSPEKARTACLVLAVHAGDALARGALAADKLARGALRRLLAGGDLAEKAGSTLLLHGIAGLPAERILLLRLGERAKYDVTAFRDAVRGLATALKGLGAKEAVLPIADLAVGGRGLPWAVRNTVLGVREVFYRFDQMKTQKKPPAPALGALA